MEPRFSITDETLCTVAQISRIIGSINETEHFDKNPVLRRKNRIQTIYGSLSIEQNTLSLEKITAVLNGKTVIAPPKDIEEVKNAFEIYELLDTLDPYSVDDLLKAHGVMMRGLLPDAGCFRERAVGVVNSDTGNIVHFGTLPAYVHEAVYNLMKWTENSKIHPLIKSCVFHYEFEQIHPFSDGNGRCGRLWHTLILSKWDPLFAWLPIESMVYRHQEEYYTAFNNCNKEYDSTEFIEFMLRMIRSALSEAEKASCSEQEQVKEQVIEKILDFCDKPHTRKEIQEFVGIEGRKDFVSNYLKPLIEDGKIVMTLPDKPNSKNQKYIKCKER